MKKNAFNVELATSLKTVNAFVVRLTVRNVMKGDVHNVNLVPPSQIMLVWSVYQIAVDVFLRSFSPVRTVEMVFTLMISSNVNNAQRIVSTVHKANATNV